MRMKGTSKRLGSINLEANSITIRTKIEGETAQQFLEIQKRGNFVTYAEVLRHLIAQVYRGTNLRLHPELLKEIERIIKNQSIARKYAFFDIEDFINRGIAFYLQKIKDERARLDDWEYRSTLQEDQRQLALVLLKLQVEKEKISGCTIEELVKESGLPETKVKQILKFFMEQDLVFETEVNDTKYYTAIISSVV